MIKNITSAFLLLLPIIFLCACSKRSNTKAREGIYSGRLYKHSYGYGNPPAATPVHTYDTFDLSFQLFLSADSIYLRSSDESLLQSMQFSKKEFDKNGFLKASRFKYNIQITQKSFRYYSDNYSPMGSGIGSSTRFQGDRH